MNRIMSLVVVGVIGLMLVGCQSQGRTTDPIEPVFSGGVPITAQPLVIASSGPQQVTVEMTWPSTPVRTSSSTATFRYVAIDLSDPDNPVIVPTGDVLAPIFGDDGDFAIDLAVPAADTKTVHSVNIAPSEAGKEYQVLVMVSMMYEGTTYAASGWFVAKP